jgi:hypothetical protein
MMRPLRSECPRWGLSSDRPRQRPLKVFSAVNDRQVALRPLRSGANLPRGKVISIP